MNEVKPIKRSVELQPLSREHHDGLLFIWKLRQGLDNNTPIETLKSFTAWYWKNHIKQHFYHEEKLLLPFFNPVDPLALRMKEEHDYIRELILAIGREPVRHDFVQLCNLIETHIRFEEREFFSYLELNLSHQELKDVFHQLEEKPITSENEWKEEFWISEKKST
jgi:hemerythrin-like domain-containing protein